MFNRPRCRDWSPLATQQLRLRNLIQITGHNIKAEPRWFIYYTLHLTSMSAPFFTSEKLESHTNANWPDINCQSIVKSAARSVCIRVWQSYLSPDNHLKGVKAIENNEQTTNCGNDKIVFAWNVYLSGLIPISKRTDVTLNENSLIFHVHGGFFTAVECLNKESIASQLYYVFYDYKQASHQLLPQYNANSQDQYTSAFTSMTLNRTSNNLVLSSGTGAYAVDVGSENMETHVPRYLLNREVDRSLNGAKKDEYIYVTGDTAETKENYSDGSDYLSPYDIDANTLKVRFLEKNFYKLEIRHSYNVDKLLLLQEKQRKFKYEGENAKEVMEKICMKSAFCLNLELISNKAMLYRPRVNPSMGRTLNRLLFVQPDQPKPEILLQAQDLRRRIEAARFRCRLLAQERNKHKQSLRQLKVKSSQYSDEALEKECALMSSYRGLCKKRELANEQHLVYLRQKEMFTKLLDTLFHRQKHLLHQLKDIYSIEGLNNSRNIFKINGVYLPNAYAYVDGSNDSDTIITPTSLCVGLGYVSHIVLLCSSILNIPLRNKIIYKGSATKMRDDIKVISEQNREFPLYCRGIPPPDSLLYAVFLLNQNISQIKFALNLRSAREDIRETLPNLRKILNIAEISAKNISKGAIGNKVSLEVINIPRTSVSESSIDISIPVPVPIPVKNTLSLSADNINVNIRNSRTIVNYSDQKLDSRLCLNDLIHSGTRKIQFNSEPLLYTSTSSR